MESKYKRCKDCGLKIRCGNVERHEQGFHHKRRIETLRQEEIWRNRHQK
jgi:hypothetical protein